MLRLDVDSMSTIHISELRLTLAVKQNMLNENEFGDLLFNEYLKSSIRIYKMEALMIQQKWKC